MENNGEENMGIKSLEWLATLSRTVSEAEGKTDGKLTALKLALDRAAQLLRSAMAAKASVWWVGNGGSAAICSHLAQDTMNKLELKSLFLGDHSLLTCMANDFGYRQVYARPLDRFASADDLLIAISSSGNSDNIISCVNLAHEKGMNIITLSGMSKNNKLWNCQSDVSFFLDSVLYGIVEVGHEAILHGIIETLWLKTKKSK